MVVMGGNDDDAHHATTHVKRLESLECCPGVREKMWHRGLNNTLTHIHNTHNTHTHITHNTHSTQRHKLLSSAYVCTPHMHAHPISF